MRQIIKTKIANVGMIGMAIAIAVTIMLSIVIIFSIYGGIGPTFTSLEDKLNGTDVSGTGVHVNEPDTAFSSKWGNKTIGPVAGGGNILSGLGTYYTLAPLIIVVMAAGVILFYVTRVGGQ